MSRSHKSPRVITKQSLEKFAGSNSLLRERVARAATHIFIIKKLKLFMEIVEGGKGNLPNRISYKKRTWNGPDIQKLSPQLYIPVVHFRT